MVEMAAPTWARARAVPHPACVRVHVQVGAALSTESLKSAALSVESADS